MNVAVIRLKEGIENMANILRLVALMSSPILVLLGVTLGFCVIQSGNGAWVFAIVPIGIAAGATWLKDLFPLVAVAVTSLVGVLGVPIANLSLIHI